MKVTADTYWKIEWNTPELKTLRGTNENDGIVGGPDHEIIYGLDGHDLLWGRDGSDELIGGKGNDYLEGEKGRTYQVDYDVYVFDSGDGFDFINILQLHERAHGDLITLRAANGADPIVSFYEQDGFAHIVYGDGGGDGNWNDYWNENYWRVNDGGIPVSDGGGTIRIGNLSLDQLKAMNLRLNVVGDERGNTLYGAWGNDYLEGLDGDDHMRGRAGQDHLIGGSGDDLLHGGSGDDVLHGGRGDDTLRAGKGNDMLYGGSGDDTFYGGQGDDLLEVWGGTNTLTGGGGKDRFHFIQANDASVNTITDFEDGVDTIVISKQEFTDLAITQEENNTVIRYDNAVITLENVQASLLSADDFVFIA